MEKGIYAKKENQDGIENQTEPQKNQTEKGLWQGLVYGVIPHLGCIGFVAASILGATVAMRFFRPLLMSRYLFHALVVISFVFATASAITYLRKNDLLSISGVKRKKSYLATMYGMTVGINLALFLFVFPFVANANSTGASLTSAEGQAKLSVLDIEVDIPCSGHAALISNELKALPGITEVRYSAPKNFEVKYDARKTTKEEILSLEVFKEYKPTVISETKNRADGETPSIKKPEAITSSGGCCGGSSGCVATCGCGGPS